MHLFSIFNPNQLHTPQLTSRRSPPGTRQVRGGGQERQEEREDGERGVRGGECVRWGLVECV